MSWAPDANGNKTWVPWIVGSPTSGDVPTWNGTYWAPAAIPAPSGPTQLQPTANSLGLYTFSGDLTDSSGNGRDLSVAGGSALNYQNRTGVGLYGVQTANGRYALTDAAWAGTATACTFEFVVKCVGTAVERFVLEIGVAPGTATSVMYQLVFQNYVPQLRFFTAAGAQKNSSGTRFIPTDSLCHVAATSEVSGGNTTVKVYTNGSLDSTTTHAGAVPNATIATPTFSALSYIFSSPNGGFVSASGQNEIHGIHVTSDVMDASTIAARALAVLGT